MSVEIVERVVVRDASDIELVIRETSDGFELQLQNRKLLKGGPTIVHSMRISTADMVKLSEKMRTWSSYKMHDETPGGSGG